MAAMGKVSNSVIKNKGKWYRVKPEKMGGGEKRVGEAQSTWGHAKFPGEKTPE